MNCGMTCMNATSSSGVICSKSSDTSSIVQILSSHFGAVMIMSCCLSSRSRSLYLMSALMSSVHSFWCCSSSITSLTACCKQVRQEMRWEYESMGKSASWKAVKGEYISRCFIQRSYKARVKSVHGNVSSDRLSPTSRWYAASTSNGCFIANVRLG